MKRPLLILSAIFVPIAAPCELPEGAATMVSKLAAWELDKQAELQAELQKKRDEVISVLEREMESTTRAGDLEGALAIKAEIERLRKPGIANKNSDDAMAPTEAKGPPGNAHRGKDSHYLWVDKSMSWEEARKTCEEMGGHLVCISDEKEWLEIREYQQELDRETTRFWIGLFRDPDNENEFSWLDSTPYEFTALSATGAGKEGKLGAHVFKGGGWAMHFITGDTFGTDAFICEWPRR
ncbi:MAG: C-type lectin domain-containing protein [Verrucomicrobiota bacterium]